MRFLQVISHYVPAHRFGGPLRVAHLLGQSLVQLGHEVTVCCTNLADEENDLDVPTDRPVTLDGLKVFYSPTRISRYWGYSPDLARRVRAEVQGADVVLVHAHFQYASLIGARIARKAGKPYIIFPHSSLHRRAIDHKNRTVKRLYLRFLESRNLENAMFLAFNAQEEMESSLYSERGTVVPNGISPAEFIERPAPGLFRDRHPELAGKTMLLFLGRLDLPQKGLDWMIPAYAEVRAGNPDLHLVLAGPDEEGGRAQLDELIARHGLEPHVTFTGLISGEDKLAALQDADAFVMSSRFEGLSIALLEALYFGLPMMVTDQVGLWREVEQSGAGIVVPSNLEGVTRGLEQIAKKENRERWRGRGTPLIEAKYTWDAIARQLVAEIESVNSGQSASR